MKKAYHLLAKPVGPRCNLNCSYCFYTEKKALFPEAGTLRMPDEVLEAYIRTYITTQDVPEIQFVWQGGEPMTAGLNYFRRIIELQNKYRGRKKIVNSLQTNGMLLNGEWCEFLKTSDFLVGLSIDGPEAVHDRYRRDSRGNASFKQVMKGLRLLQKYNIPYNVLACVTRESAGRPLEIYPFFKAEGIEFIQFIPVVERLPSDIDRDRGFAHAPPPELTGGDPADTAERGGPALAPYSVEPEAYGDFLNAVFDQWVRSDVGSVFVMNFEWALQAWAGLPSTICIFAETCGRAMAVEHNGDIFSCDHFVYPEYRLGNVLKDDPGDLAELERQRLFGSIKKTALPRMCMECDVLFACRGECPKHRFIGTPDGEPGLNYLCAGYKKYFRYIRRYMNVMVQLIENNLPVENVMDAVKGPVLYVSDNPRGHLHREPF